MEQENVTPLDPPMSSSAIAQKDLPNAGGVLTLGILAIVFAGLIGLILGIIALSLAGKARELYNSDPSAYTATSLSRVNGGRTCAIIGISLSGLAILIIGAAMAS